MTFHTQIVPSLKLFSAAALALILVGCGGGGGSSSSGGGTATVNSSAAAAVSSTPTSSADASSTPASTVASSEAPSSTPASSAAPSSTAPSSVDASSAVASSTATSSAAANTVTISGAAVAKSADVATVASLSEKIGRFIAKINPIARAWAAVDIGSTGNEALANADVELVKIFGNGIGEDVVVPKGTVTTDDTGAYTLPDVEKVPASDGTDEPFYYEVRISKNNLEIKTPVAATADVVANVSPETDLAAKILTGVVAVPDNATPPLPPATMVESIRELVLAEVATLTDDKAIAIPSALSNNFDANSLAAANGLAANGGNAEKLFKAASFSAEETALVNNPDATDADTTGYINRVVREGCDQKQGDYLPQPIAEAFGEDFKNGGKLTPTQIVAAYNHHFTGPQVVLNTVVTNFKNMLTDVTDKLAAPAQVSAEIDATKQLALYTMRALDPATFAADTELDADQALAFIQTLGNQQCSTSNQLDMFGFVAELLTKPELATPTIAFADIYHNSGFGCNEGSGKGHFVASVKVNRKGKTITSVTIASDDSDTTVLGGTGTTTLTSRPSTPYDGFESNSNGACVNLGKDVSYTVTANFSDSTTATTTVDRNHPRIPEAASQVLVGETFQPGANNSTNPTVVSVTRPLYQWTSPATMLDGIINDNANLAIKTELQAGGYTVKYTYEFAHVDTSAVQVSPANQCDSVSAGALYSVDSFVPTKDCDVKACALKLNVDPSKISCRMNIQSYLVDKNDKILGQAAGHFRFFCVDTDNDGNCG